MSGGTAATVFFTTPDRSGEGWFERIGGAFSSARGCHLGIFELFTFSVKGALADWRDSSLLCFRPIEAVHCRRSFGLRCSIMRGKILFE